MVPSDPRWYERVGSGEATEVPELDAALADARAGAYDVLVVLTTSRFARNRAEAIRRKGEFARAGVPIYFVQERIVSGSRHGRLLEGIREVLDEEENEVRRGWIAGGLRERQKAGRWVGRVPYGYRLSLIERPDGTRVRSGTLEPDPERAEIVRSMFRAALAGATPADIARDLNRRGIPGPLGGFWRPSTVRRLLANPIYVGELVRYWRSHPLHYYDERGPDGRSVVAKSPALIPPAWGALVAARLS